MAEAAPAAAPAWTRPVPHATALSGLLTVALGASVVGTTGGRLALVASAAVTGLGAAALLARSRAGRAGLLLCAILGALLLAGPGRDRDSLERRYVAALERYTGAPYVWGGESPRGIDCSGLVRQALVDASLREGLLGLDGRSLRRAAELWWFDCSASALGAGHSGLTRPVSEASTLAALDPRPLQAGDLAITHEGRHVLAYLGDGRWIQADPVAARVVVGDWTHARLGWPEMSVRVVRWSALAAR
jgi:hypothetical protein